MTVSLPPYHNSAQAGPVSPSQRQAQPDLTELKELLQQAKFCQVRRQNQLESLKREVARLRWLRTGMS